MPACAGAITAEHYDQAARAFAPLPYAVRRIGERQWKRILRERGSGREAFATPVAGHVGRSTIAAIPGEKVIMAHSLGNMVVSSMIQDHGLAVSKCLMCDSAVPSEAYYPPEETSIRIPQLVHPDWEEYPTNSWASNWHKLFKDDVDDDRRHLGWPGRFADVARYAVNFYSAGDEVLELVDDNDLSVLDGITSGYVQYCWRHQELWKGRSVIDGLGGTTWAGWNIDYCGLRCLEASPGMAGEKAVLSLESVFNPTPNDTNLEDMDIAQRTHKQIELDKRLEKERREKEAKTVWGGIKKIFDAP